MMSADGVRQGLGDAAGDDDSWSHDVVGDWNSLQIPLTVDKTNEIYSNVKIQDIEASDCMQMRRCWMQCVQNEEM